MNPDSLRYTKDHEWIGESGGMYAVGITHHAQDLLGDITYVELPDAGREVTAHEEVATVESVKAASDLYAPVAGTIVEVNEALETDPGLVNTDPYGEGWFFKLSGADPAAIAELMDAAAYTKYVEESAE